MNEIDVIIPIRVEAGQVRHQLAHLLGIPYREAL
jgi:hypothetical protein